MEKIPNKIQFIVIRLLAPYRSGATGSVNGGTDGFYTYNLEFCAPSTSTGMTTAGTSTPMRSTTTTGMRTGACSPATHVSLTSVVRVLFLYLCASRPTCDLFRLNVLKFLHIVPVELACFPRRFE